MEEPITNENIMPWDQPIPPVEVKQGQQCPKCNRVFANEKGLRMHTIRIHSGKGWNTAANFGKNAEVRRLRKNAYQRRLRERYRREGKLPMLKKNRFPSESPEYKHAAYQKYKARNRALGLNARGRPLAGTIVAAQLAQNDMEADKVAANNSVQQHGDAASAILLAASVIRAVATGLRIGQ